VRSRYVVSTTSPDSAASERRIARNTALLFASKIASKPLFLLYIFLVARHLGVESFGTYSFVLTFAGFFAVLADFGLKTPLQRAIARDTRRTSIYVTNAILIKAALSLVTVAAFHAAAVLLGYSSSYGILLYVGLAIVLLDSMGETILHVFRAHQVLKYEALVGIARGILMLLLAYLVMMLGGALFSLLIIMLVTVSIVTGFVAGVYVKRFSTGGGRYERKIAGDFLGMALVFGLGSGLYTLYNKIDILMLERMVGQGAVGVYAAAYTLLENLEVVSIVYTASFMPFLFRALAGSRAEALKACGSSLSWLLALGLPAATMLTLLSSEVVGFLYGAEFAASSPALAVLVWTAPVKYAFAVLSMLLIAHDREATGLVLGALGVLVNVLMNLALIPVYAQLGAAIATLGTELLMLGLQAAFVARYVGTVPLPKGSARLLVSNVLLGAIIWAARPLGLLPVLLLACTSYLVLLSLTGFLTRKEWAHLRGMMGK
jgi:O-antigen/teichoic acid export membrane protein